MIRELNFLFYLIDARFQVNWTNCYLIMSVYFSKYCIDWNSNVYVHWRDAFSSTRLYLSFWYIYPFIVCNQYDLNLRAKSLFVRKFILLFWIFMFHVKHFCLNVFFIKNSCINYESITLDLKIKLGHSHCINFFTIKLIYKTCI